MIIVNRYCMFYVISDLSLATKNSVFYEDVLSFVNSVPEAIKNRRIVEVRAVHILC